MAEGQYYQIKYRYRLDEHILENVVNYVHDVEGTDANPAEGLARAFDLQFLDLFELVQSVFVVNVHIDCINLDNFGDNYRMGVAQLSSGGGTVAGERLAFWNAYVWTKTPVNRSFKVGLFRLRGVVEANSFSEQINSESMTPVTAITNALPDTLTTVDGSVFVPIVMRSIRVPSDPELPLTGWLRSHTLISGINFKGLGHLVNNK